jgi:hypothetical protein
MVADSKSMGMSRTAPQVLGLQVLAIGYAMPEFEPRIFAG